MALVLPDGRTLEIRGRVDRVDVAADGTVHVIDYKTGSLRGSYLELSESNPVAGGTRLQLPVYGLAGRAAARPARRGAGGVLVRHRQGRVRRVGYDITPDVLGTTVRVLDVIVRGVEGGVFPPHPSPLSTYFRIECHL